MPYQHLTESERELIARFHQSGQGVRVIGRMLCRSAGTISRELRRNRAGESPYHGGVADVIATERRRRVQGERVSKLSGRLLKYVMDHLRKGWTPEAISGRLTLDHGRASAMRMSHETIYAFVWDDKRAGGSLWRHLRRGRRRKRKIGRRGGGVIRDRVPISERPAVVERRGRVGDFEGDTIVGKGGRSYVVTTVCRKSRLLLTSLVRTKQAAVVRRALRRQFGRLPAGTVKTLTVDNGTEFAEHASLTRQTGVAVYFATPYSSWERGTNENTNGLLRSYFPKGTDFRDISSQRLAHVTAALNNRPRKCLGYRTPREVFDAAINTNKRCASLLK